MDASQQDPQPAPDKRETPPPSDHDNLQWRDALDLAQSIPAAMRPSPAQLATLANACADPGQLRLLLDAFAHHATSLPTGPLPYPLLCEFVDDSAHDLRQWINALIMLIDWPRKNERKPQPLSMLLPYLACSAEAQVNSPLPLSLQHIVADMLELYGYDGDAPTSTEP